MIYDAYGTAVVGLWNPWDIDANEDAIFEANARLFAKSRELLEALELALRALNTIPNTKVGDTNSYSIASVINQTIAEAKGENHESEH